MTCRRSLKSCLATRTLSCFSRRLVLTSLSLMSLPAGAAMQSTSTTVANLRVEGSWGFIGVTVPLPVCGSRVWVDMSNPLGRTVYSTALMAHSTGRSTTIRAYDESTRVFGACQLYDIYVE